MNNVDHIVYAKWIITCEDENRILENHALIIKADKIVAILPEQEVKEKYQAKSEHHYSSHALIPGFINSHTHIAMNIFKGLADDLNLMDWLTHYIWPAETKWVSEELVYDASLLAMGEMIRCGTTCFNDMYFFPGATAKAAEKSGMRAHIGMTIIDVPTAWAKTADEYFEKGLEFYHQYKNHARIVPIFAPHSVYSLSRPDLERVKNLAEEHHLKIDIHLQEAASDIDGALKLHQARPLQFLNELGLVSPNLIAIHMTQLDQQDLDILQEKKPNIVHCPESNMKLASGICPVQTLTDLGINVALGTDGAASNNDLDMIGEMRSATFLAKISTHNPKALPAMQALKMATINGAKALGIDHLTGSLEPGKSADFAAIDLEQIETQPLYHPLSQIVYAGSRNQVTDVWIAGSQVLKNRQLLTLDEKELLNKAQSWRKKIKN